MYMPYHHSVLTCLHPQVHHLPPRSRKWEWYPPRQQLWPVVDADLPCSLVLTSVLSNQVQVTSSSSYTTRWIMLDLTDSQVRPSTQVPSPHRSQESGIRGNMSKGNEVSIHLMTNHMGSSVRDWFSIHAWYSDRHTLSSGRSDPIRTASPSNKSVLDPAESNIAVQP
jgi:hypothetical protein